MTLTERMTTELHEAMKSGATDKRDVLRLAITALKNETVALKHELSDAESEAVIARFKKQLLQAAEEYRTAGNNERAEAELAEAALLTDYLPEQLSVEELKAIVVTAVADAGDNASMGSVIQAVKSIVGNRAQGGTIATMVKVALGN